VPNAFRDQPYVWVPAGSLDDSESLEVVIYICVGLKAPRDVGTYAVEHAASIGENGSVAIKRESSVTPLSTVAREATPMKPEYINDTGNDVTQVWLDYLAPLVGDLPKMGRL